MPHLVAPLGASTDGQEPLSLARCHELVREAHAYLTQRGVEAAREAAQLATTDRWGTTSKRVRVRLPLAGRPLLVHAAADDHSLGEVINQCATMERLLDALVWAQGETSGLRDYAVLVCHPTTSSAPRRRGHEDNDLILVAQDGRRARFEVSDVIGRSDGNGKEESDLQSLGVLADAVGAARFAVAWPAARVFLVVAREFAQRLERRSWPHLRYEARFVGDATAVLEVLPRDHVVPSGTDAGG